MAFKKSCGNKGAGEFGQEMDLCNLTEEERYIARLLENQEKITDRYLHLRKASIPGLCKDLEGLTVHAQDYSRPAIQHSNPEGTEEKLINIIDHDLIQREERSNRGEYETALFLAREQNEDLNHVYKLVQHLDRDRQRIILDTYFSNMPVKFLKGCYGNGYSDLLADAIRELARQKNQ